ncbi:biotin/lipoyl-containing protein [Opitutus terrae]|uniref:Biotin/lipoyl attachment domain-containing protein n=1 Tax=Opitutus terrae (strain DSM 11246 / JCM 15787 / PB90-1) TaxID=452637 RepID=B1ZWL7_OPITP|nr:biotin/lipoyl-containing protein [Opitutus terrae]ACB73341.1 biotin/lipoyl attachment domain-containing protein [Opitutus terrae PB90-1]
METFIIDVPVPSMGATVSELNVIVVTVKPGDRVARGQRLGDLESDKSTFEFESPCEGVIRNVVAQVGQTLQSGQVFCQIETSDESQRHLASKSPGGIAPAAAAPSAPAAAAPSAPAAPPKPLVWTPRATKLAQEAGLDPAKVTDIEATGPGNRVSGDDVTAYLKKRQG